MSTRRKAREVALQILYKADISEGGATVDYSQELESLKHGTEARRYSELLVSGVLGKTRELDDVIEGCSTKWKINRMSVVDRNILRLSVFELVYCTDVPYKVVIDEAVELAKRFGSEDSAAFINGILDRVHKELPGSATAR